MVVRKSPSVKNRGLLIQRIKGCRHNYPLFDDMVDHLLSSYRDYQRIKRVPFKSLVQEVIALLDNSQENNRSCKSNPSASTPNNAKLQVVDSDDEVDDGVERGRESGAIHRKRHKRVDETERSLQSWEDSRVKRIRHNKGQSSDSESSHSAGSMSEDAIYSEKVEPEFDFMKSTLRTSYMNSNKSKSRLVEKNVELDLAIDNKVARKIHVASEQDISKEQSSNKLKKEDQGSVSGQETSDVREKWPRFKDLGGMKEVLDQLKMEVIAPLYDVPLVKRLGVSVMTGILLHGPPGCGKTQLVHAIANETGLPFYKISATEVVSGVSGASEENIRALFSKAYRTAPSIVFIDEIDVIASKRENLSREMEKRIVTQLMACMDECVKSADVSSKKDNSDVRSGRVLIFGATNRPDALDPALRRPGRFDFEIVLGVPDENSRAEILSVLTSNMELEGSFDLLKIARATPGFVGADLKALTNMAGNLVMKRIFGKRKDEFSLDSIDEEHAKGWWSQLSSPEEIDNVAITMADFEEAIKMVQPSLRREGFSAIPNVKWDDVGGLDELRREFDRYIVRRIKYPKDYEDFGMNLDIGILLHGPPGCGKTLIAKAVANEAGANFIHIKGPELLSKYVGDSELAVRTLFSRARTCAPCILFFDEVDTSTKKRDKEGGVMEQVLNQLLIELDGGEKRHGVFVIGATNRPQVMDRAVLRPGRFGKLIHVPLPGPDERGKILQVLGRKMPIDDGVDLVAIGRMDACKNFSGSHLAALMEGAVMAALEEKHTSIGNGLDSAPATIKMTHIHHGLAEISRSMTIKHKKLHQKRSARLKSA